MAPVDSSEERPERRAYPRWPIALNVELVGLDATSPATGTSKDVSLGGARLSANRAVGGHLFAVLSAPAGERVIALAADVLDAHWVAEAVDLRLQFAHPSDDSREALGRFLERARSGSRP